MIPPRLPPDEAERLKYLQSLNQLDTPAEERFDCITRMAMKLFSVPISLITLVDKDRQWFRSVQGLDVSETSREVSFCGHTILSDDPMIVGDAASDLRFCDNPLVTEDPNIRFYVGCPLISSTGFRLGTLCLIDRVPREGSSVDIEILRDLTKVAQVQLEFARSNQVERELLEKLEETGRRAALDPLTSTWNRGALDSLLSLEVSRLARTDSSLSVLMLDIDNFKLVNDKYGHRSGDMVLRETANRIRSVIRPYDSLCRYGGEEFVVLIPGSSSEDAERIAERVRLVIAETPVQVVGTSISVTVSVGVCHSPFSTHTPDGALECADSAMYLSKKSGKNRVSIL